MEWLCSYNFYLILDMGKVLHVVYQMFFKMYVKHYCDYFYHKLSICYCIIYNFLWIHMYEREEVMINVFLVGPIPFSQPQKRKQKGKKSGCVAQYWSGKIKLKPKKWAENSLNVHCIYVFEQNLRLYPFK
jgi:hypothetical protein